MKKTILACLSFFSVLYADPVDDLKFTVFDNLPDLYGWCSREKANAFIDLVLETKPQLCVEIGVFGGSSIYPVASTLKLLGQGVIVAIDPWDKVECIRYLDPDKDKTNLRWWANIQLEHVYFRFLSLIKEFELEKVCVILKSTSHKAAPALGPIDILYIDGNHYEKIATGDVRLYLPKVKQGGYIWFNDTKWTSLKPAIDLLAASCDVVKSIENGNCILFRKR